jgi:hypothetical protein
MTIWAHQADGGLQPDPESAAHALQADTEVSIHLDLRAAPFDGHLHHRHCRSQQLARYCLAPCAAAHRMRASRNWAFRGTLRTDIRARTCVVTRRWRPTSKARASVAGGAVTCRPMPITPVAVRSSTLANGCRRHQTSSAAGSGLSTSLTLQRHAAIYMEYVQQMTRVRAR